MTDSDLFKTGGGLSRLGAALDNDPLVGQAFGSYRIKALLAEGGMGRVYRAVRADGQFDREVAIKVLPPGLGKEYSQRFEQERQILASLSHPNIAQLFDAGLSDSGNLYLVMELIDGMPIDEFVRKRALGTDAKSRLMLTLSEALAFAHSRLVVHRDLKPSNVFVTNDGDLRLLDFGIAKILEAPDSVTVESRPMTPRYASPEQLLNEPISVASDIYQLGLLFLSLFEQHGDLPEETQASATERAVKKTSITVDSRVAEKLPAELGAIINQCLRAEPSERYASATDLAADLRNFLGGFPVSARNPGPLQRTAKFLRRNWLPASLTAVIIAVTVGGTLYYIDSIDKERQAVIAANEKAREEAALANSVSDFLVRMISGANALYAPGEPRTVPDAVVHGAGLLRSELSDQPAVRVRLVNELAGVLNSMNEWAKTRDMLVAAMPDLVDDPTVDFEQRGILRSNLAYATYRLSEFDNARQQYREIIAVYEAAGETGNYVYANAWRRLGLLERRAANFDLAAEMMANAEAAYNRSNPPELSLAGFISDYGLVLSHQEDKTAAIEKYEASIRLFRKLQGDECTRCALTQVNLAWALREQERFDEALTTIQEADQTFRRYLGDDYGSRQGSVLFEMAAIHNQMGNYEEADRLHRQASALYLNDLGRRSSLYALSLYNHAQTHRDHGRCDLALPLLYEAREIHVELFGEDGEWVRKDDARIAECQGMLESG
jgi:serine/threonine-protein kinase